MGYWGVKSYENDEAEEALDRAFETVHGTVYEDLMDDRNPLTIDEIQARLANPATLQAALDHLLQEHGPLEDRDDEARLGYAGVVVRHAELGVALMEACRTQAVEWLRDEAIDWDEATLRKLRLAKEIEILQAASGVTER